MRLVLILVHMSRHYQDIFPENVVPICSIKNLGAVLIVIFIEARWRGLLNIL